MARDARTRSASLCAVIVTTAKVDGFQLGYVENININESFASELIPAVGYAKPRENVMHGVTGADISWSGAKTTVAESMQQMGLSPEDAEITAFNPITVAFFDTDRGETICEVQGVLPSSIGISTGAMAKLMESFNGRGITVKWGSEFR